MRDLLNPGCEKTKKPRKLGFRELGTGYKVKKSRIFGLLCSLLDPTSLESRSINTAEPMKGSYRVWPVTEVACKGSYRAEFLRAADTSMVNHEINLV